MKITDIQIDRFGVWQDLSLPLTSSGLNVFYGPNEAGKTTLMRFVRSVLYGFEPLGLAASGSRGEELCWEGRLRVEHHQQLCDIQRVSHRDTCGLLSVTGLDRDAAAEELLTDLLAGTTKRVFDDVFAIGLRELQSLATLESDEVAQHIYGMSLGHRGQRLLDMTSQIRIEGRNLLDSHNQSGTLVELFAQFDQLSAELQQFEGAPERHAELCEQRNHLEASITGLKTRQEGMQSQLRGHTFLERIWEPWNRIRDYQAELDKLPVVVAFPESGLVRLGELEAELTTATNCQETLLQEATEFRKQTAELPIDAEFEKHAAVIQSFIDQRGWVAELDRQIAETTVRADDLKQNLDEKLSQLGPDWPLNRLESVDTSPAAHFRLVNTAKQYQTALSRRAKLKHRLERLSATCQKRMAELSERTKLLRTHSIDEALIAAKQRLADLEEVGTLKLRLTELQQRRIGINDQLGRLQERLSLPKWVYAVLMFFGVFGVVFAVLGIVTGVMTSGLGGTMYALFGTTCGLMAWALKSHLEGDVRDTVERLQDEARENEIRLRETQAAVDRVTIAETAPATVAIPVPNEAAVTPVPVAHVVSQTEMAGQPTPAARPEPISVPDGIPIPAAPARMRSDADLIREATHQLAELEQMAQTERLLQSTRRKLSQLRSRLQTLQREVCEAKQDWCELLTGLGFSETVRIDEAFEAWQRVVEAHERRRSWESANAELKNRQQTLQAFQQRIEELGRRLNRWDVDYTEPLNVLAAWEEELKVLGQNQSQRRRLRREEKTRRREAAQYRRRIDELNMRRSALFVQAGAASREEFEQRAAWIEQRREIEQLQSSAQAELKTASQAEPKLAVVEEDLLDYNAGENSECIRMLTLELEELERELQQAFEQLGGCKQELTDLQSDRRSTNLRFERELIAEQIRQAGEKWFAVGLADQMLEQIRARFERDCQPATLRAASGLLKRLTGGRYQNVWTPLGERHLCIDDDRDDTYLVDQLSGGTREQLFLAIRLALIRQLAQDGVELPMVLDDVIVNFDQLRTEAAVQTLIEFAEQGQQILLFTCHLHLAHLFESKGFEPIWLPGHNPPMEERRAG